MNHTTEVVYNSVFHNAIRLQVNLCFLYNCLEISCRATLGLGYKATFKQVHKSVGFRITVAPSDYSKILIRPLIRLNVIYVNWKIFTFVNY